MIHVSNTFLIKFFSIIRLCLWYFVLLLCALARAHFIVQTWSKTFIFVLIFNLSFSIINLFVYKQREYYQKLQRILAMFLPILTMSTLIVYLIYMFNVYYRIMDLVTINIMVNDRNTSLMSRTLNYYQCCRIQEEILFDSVNERDYFLLFPYCEKVIIENEARRDLWDNITTCGSLFRSIIFYIRVIVVFDLIFNIILTILGLTYVWEDNSDQWIENKQCTLLKTNYKIK